MTRRPAHHARRRVWLPLSVIGAAFLATFAIALVGASAGAQEPPARVVSATHDPAGTVTVTLGANRSLDASEVQAAVDGVDLGPAQLLDGSEAALPATVVIAIETSSSMLFGKLEEAQAAALSLVDALGAGDRAAVVAYGDTPRVVSALTTDRAETRAAIESLSTGTFASIYGGVGTASEVLSGVGGPSALVVIGWGWDFGTASTYTRQSSIDALLATGASAYWVPVGFDWDGAYFGALTGPSGGRQLAVGELPSLPAELGGATASTQTFRFASPVLASGARDLTVVVAGAPLSTTLEVTNDGLIEVGEPVQAEPSAPITISVRSVASLSGLTTRVTIGGSAVSGAIAGDAITLDPWVFDPGSVALQIEVLAGDEVAATASTSVAVPTLAPELSLVESELGGDPAVDVTWRVQGSAPASLEVLVDGELAFEGAESPATVPVASGGEVVARVAHADGSELIADTLTVAAPSSGGALPSPPIMAVLALMVAAVIAGGLFAWRARRPVRPPDFSLRELWGRLPKPSFGGVSRPSMSRPNVSLPSASMPARGRGNPLAGFGTWLQGLRARLARPRAPIEVEEPALAIVVVRDPSGVERRIPIRDTQLSVGASRQCDVTLPGPQVRFVHLILTAVGDGSYRLFRFGAVALADSGEEIADDALVHSGQWVAVGEHVLRVEEPAQAATAAA